LQRKDLDNLSRPSAGLGDGQESGQQCASQVEPRRTGLDARLPEAHAR